MNTAITWDGQVQCVNTSLSSPDFSHNPQRHLGTARVFREPTRVTNCHLPPPPYFTSFPIYSTFINGSFWRRQCWNYCQTLHCLITAVFANSILEFSVYVIHLIFWLVFKIAKTTLQWRQLMNSDVTVEWGGGGPPKYASLTGCGRHESGYCALLHTQYNTQPVVGVTVIIASLMIVLWSAQTQRCYTTLRR